MRGLLNDANLDVELVHARLHRPARIALELCDGLVQARGDVLLGAGRATMRPGYHGADLDGAGQFSDGPLHVGVPGLCEPAPHIHGLAHDWK